MKTKDKGDIGQLKVMADLMAQGVHVAEPYGDNLPFDLIAVVGEKHELKKFK